MTTLREAAQQALEALMDAQRHNYALKHKETDGLITALRAALAEPVQEPVAMDWLHKWANQDDGEPETQWHEGYEAARRVVQIHLTAPPQRKPLTDEEMRECAQAMDAEPLAEGWFELIKFARAIERAHGIGGGDG